MSILTTKFMNRFLFLMLIFVGAACGPSLSERPWKSLTNEEKIKRLDEEGIFLKYTGCYTLCQGVKKAMNDPDSFDHVESKIFLTGETSYVVVMTYRGKNAFGGIVTQTIRAEMDTLGNVIKLFE